MCKVEWIPHHFQDTQNVSQQQFSQELSCNQNRDVIPQRPKTRILTSEAEILYKLLADIVLTHIRVSQS